MIIVRRVRLPYAVRGVTSPNPDGTYTIFLNSRLSPEQQRQVFAHEVAHIQQEHFSDGLSLHEAEYNASHAPFPRLPEDPDAVDSPFFFTRLPHSHQSPLSSLQLRRLTHSLSPLLDASPEKPEKS